MATQSTSLTELTRPKTGEAPAEKSVEILDSQAFAFLLCNTSGGNFRLFPYHHLADAELSERKDLLVVHMWSHTVTITGHRLLPLLQGLRRAQDVTVRAQDAKYEATQGKDAPFVVNIEIVKRKEDEDENDDAGQDGGRKVSLTGDKVTSAAVRATD